MKKSSTKKVTKLGTFSLCGITKQKTELPLCAKSVEENLPTIFTLLKIKKDVSGTNFIHNFMLGTSFAT